MAKSNSKIIILSIVFGIGLTLLLFNNFFKPWMKSNKTLVKELKLLQDDVNTLTSVFNDERQILKMQRKVEKLEKHLLRKIPEDFSIPELNDMLTKPSRQFNFEVISLSFGSQEEIKFGGSEEGAIYNVIPINLGINIAMDRLIEYLYWIKSQDNLVTVASLSIQSNPDLPGIVKATMLINAYSYLHEESISPFDTGSTKFNETFLKKSLKIPEQKTIDLSQYRRSQIFPEVQSVVETQTQQKNNQTVQSLKLNGIVIKNPKKLSIVIINGELLKQGDTIMGYKVVDIGDKRVTLENNIKSIDLKIDSPDYRR